MKKKILLAVFMCLGLGLSAQMTQVSGFGTNPGNLEMFLFEPSAPKMDAAVVLVLHGCGQNANNFAEATGWNVLAEQYGFYVVYAQQKIINNPVRCFNWFLSTDNERGAGEAKSLIEMVDYVHNNYTTDVTKSFVCGLSAGGAMTPVMMACYPDRFKSGGVWAGVPYLYSPTGNNDISAEEWGNKARSAYPDYTGDYPTLFICQGLADSVTEPINESRLVAQWTNVHETDQNPDVTNFSFLDNPAVRQDIYLNDANDTIIKSYTITDMGHGIAVDPGEEAIQGGQAGAGAYDVDFYSTYWMANFFGIIDNGTVNTVDQLSPSELKVFTLNDGSLKVLNTTNQSLQVLVFDMLGRTLVQRELYDEVTIPSSQLNNRRVVAVTILNNRRQSVYSKLLMRN